MDEISHPVSGEDGFFLSDKEKKIMIAILRHYVAIVDITPRGDSND